MKRNIPHLLILPAITFAVLLLTGCTPKNIAYFQDIETLMPAEVTDKPITIKPEDKLSIVVHSKDDQLSKLFNLPVVATNVTSSASVADAGTLRSSNGIQAGMSVYTVDPAGDIEFPILGKIHIGGMTRSEIAGFIKGELMGRDLVKDPTVTVEFLNVGINVLGDVRNPGRIEVNRDHLTLLDALALAGDLNITGRRDNVTVIREEKGKRNVYRIDLTKSEQAMKSPGFMLQQNDVIVVEPNDWQKRQTTTNGNTTLSASFWLSVASLLASVAVLIFK